MSGAEEFYDRAFIAALPRASDPSIDRDTIRNHVELASAIAMEAVRVRARTRTDAYFVAIRANDPPSQPTAPDPPSPERESAAAGRRGHR